jgi:hypothetical protein
MASLPSIVSPVHSELWSLAMQRSQMRLARKNKPTVSGQNIGTVNDQEMHHAISNQACRQHQELTFCRDCSDELPMLRPKQAALACPVT